MTLKCCFVKWSALIGPILSLYKDSEIRHEYITEVHSDQRKIQKLNILVNKRSEQNSREQIERHAM